jgi:hypothetical protein
MNNTYKSLIKSTRLKLVNYIENELYLGWDPYDGLNSKILENYTEPTS